MNRTDQLTMKFHEVNTCTPPDKLMSIMEEMVHHMADLQDENIKLRTGALPIDREKELHSQIEELRSEIEDIHEDFYSQIEELRSEIGGIYSQIEELRSEIEGIYEDMAGPDI